MGAAEKALDTVVNLFLRGLDLLLGVFAAIEATLRGAMAGAGVPPGAQTIILVLAALALFVLGFKVLSGFLRILLILFLALLVVQFLGPLGGGKPRRAELPMTTVSA